MRGRHILFLHILALLFVMFSSDVFAEGDGTLVFTNEPTDAQLNSLAMYVTPSKSTVETLIQWSNSCYDNVDKLLNRSNFLTSKRTAAETAAYGGLTWKSKTKKVASTAEQVLTSNYSGLLVTFVNELVDRHDGINSKIRREQKYALACQEVNAHIPKFGRALSQWQRMYNMADLVLGRWRSQNSTDIIDYLQIYESYTLPSATYPTWA